MAGEVTVTLYAPFRELVGGRQVRLPAAAPLRAGELLRLLGERYPKLAPYVSATGEGGAAVMVIVNERMAGLEDAIHPGDEVSLCAQICGGCRRAPGEPGARGRRGPTAKGGRHA
jgi:molybdopterin converting factor small subunit